VSDRLSVAVQGESKLAASLRVVAKLLVWFWRRVLRFVKRSKIAGGL
jgi:hypothetical protein